MPNPPSSHVANRRPINLDVKPSYWVAALNITKHSIDPVRWNKEWERALRKLTPKKIYPQLSEQLRKILESQHSTLNEGLTVYTKRINKETALFQRLMFEMWDTGARERTSTYLTTVWLLLGDEQRTKYLKNGMEEACRYVLLGQDTRAMCPEMTITALSKTRGQPFLDLVEEIRLGRQGQGGAPYLFPSAWWDKAEIEVQRVSKPMFTLLTLLRTSFITQVLLTTIQPLVTEMVNKSDEINPVTEYIKSNVYAHGFSRSLLEMPTKPQIRCENCTKSSEELQGKHAKFMLCGSCKSKLDFSVHYCSRECQKKDWSKHKVHCGKEKTAKKLRGTVHDPLWRMADAPDHLLDSLNPTPDGAIFASEVGFSDPTRAGGHSDALRRQTAFLDRDRDADYYLFDERGRPVRFEISEVDTPYTKLVFRLSRADVFISPPMPPRAIEAIAEHLIQYAAQIPGLNRRRILAQLSLEYGMDVEEKLVAFQQLNLGKGQRLPSESFVDFVGNDMLNSGPIMDNIHRSV